jgi:FtsZ-interacting cell division protein ZipA
MKSLLSGLICMALLCPTALWAAESEDKSVADINPEKPRRKLSLEKQAEQGRIDSKKLEQSQLEKAREAAKATTEREQGIIERQQQGEWQDKQREKAKAQFNERAERENKYLKQAQEAAGKERKITEDAPTKED